ncbi:uncharacterized protein LOC144653307 [Oculina patagonica]
MIRLRWIRAIWSGRVPSTWVLSKTFLSSEATISGKAPENGQNTHIEKKMKHHIKTGNIADAARLFEESRNEGNSWVVDSCYSTLLHMFVQHGQHETADTLYKDIKQNASYIGEGAKTTMIKSYCNREHFDEAIEMLRSITEDNRAHHTRHYNYVITSLAKSGLTKQALQLFEEKLERQQSCLASRSDRCLSVDNEMIRSLLNPSNVRTKENNQSKREGSNSMGRFELSGDRRNSQDGYTYGILSQKVFHYLEQAGERLPVKLLQVIHSRFNHDPVYQWTWKTCSVSEIGTCSSCGNQLTSGIPPSDIHQLECEIIRLSSSPQQNGSEVKGKKLDKKMHKELEDFKKFVKERGPFDVIIDGMNVGAFGSVSSFTFTANRLKETAHHFAAQQKKVLLIINNNILVWKGTKDLQARLEDVCAVFRNKFKNDDLYLLYAAAFSGMQQVEVVTNDRLRDHRLLLPTNLWWTFLRWTRLNCVSFTINDKGKLSFSRQKYDPVVQRCGNSWHFPAKDHTWRCVTRTGRKGETIH